MDSAKVVLVYSTPLYRCYAVTTVLTAWIGKDLILLGYGCKPCEEGVVTAKKAGILIRQEDILELHIRMEDLTIDTLVEASLTERRSLLLPSQIDMLIYSRPNFGRFINFKQGSRFACMSLRRFPELIGYAGIQYVEKTAPMFSMPTAFDD